MLASVTVLMGGGDITATAYADGKIHIPAVTGDLTIRAEAVAKAAEYVAYSAPMNQGSALNRAGAVVSATENWLCSDFIPAAPGQNFRYTGDTAPYGEYASVWGYDEGGSPAALLVDNGNHLAGTEFTVPEGVYGLRCCAYGANGFALEVRGDQADLAREAALIPGFVVSSMGAESAREGGGVTDYLPVHEGCMVLVYNIVPANGGRFAFYDDEKAFVEAVTIYDQSGIHAGMAGTAEIPANAAYVRISTNVAQSVRAAVMEGVG